jgi:hypothetical protein
MATWIGDNGTVLDDRAARGVLARAPLFWEGEKGSSLAGARCEGGRFVGRIARSRDFYRCRSRDVVDGIKDSRRDRSGVARDYALL